MKADYPGKTTCNRHGMANVCIFGLWEVDTTAHQGAGLAVGHGGLALRTGFLWAHTPPSQDGRDDGCPWGWLHATTPVARHITCAAHSLLELNVGAHIIFPQMQCAT